MQISNNLPYTYNNLASDVTHTAQASNMKNKNPKIDGAKDKSEAVKYLMGYGVDSKGYFTSDLNQAARIPKDYKVDSTLGITYDLMSMLGYYKDINLAGSVNNAYHSFSKLSKEEQDKIIEETKGVLYLTDDGKEKSLYTMLLEQYSDGKGGLSESGRLEAYMYMRPDFIEAEQTIHLAIQDRNGAYGKFIQDSDNLLGMNIFDKGKAGQLLRKGLSELTPEEFGKQWEEIRKEYQAKSHQKREKEEEENHQSFKPIVAKSKNKESYKEGNYLGILQLFESRQKLEQVQILLQQYTNKSPTSLEELKGFFNSSWKRLDKEV